MQAPPEDVRDYLASYFENKCEELVGRRVNPEWFNVDHNYR